MIFDRTIITFNGIKRRIVLLGLLLGCALLQQAVAQKKSSPVPPIVFKNGQLTYTAEPSGDRIPDFSYCGYMASEKAIPSNVPVKVVVPVMKGDATNRIQSALDYVASLALDATGFRGAVLLQKGNYDVSGQLRITMSGIVLRGSGMNPEGTIITGMGISRLALVKILGKNDKSINTEIRITSDYVPVSAMGFSVADATAFKPGDKVIIRRPSTKEWIDTIGTAIFGGGISALGWKPGDHDLYFDRTITNINANTITIDAPITTALDAKFGGATIASYNWSGRVNNTGIENLRCISAYDKNNLKDEDHRWNAISIENATDAWIKQISFENFAGSAVSVLESKRITVEDCNSLHPVSEIGGQRRYTFLTTGQQTLFQRCYAERGYHDFAVGYCAPGPNAFVQCESHLPYNFSGAIDSWASGILFDIVNVDGNALRFGNRGQDANGAGWAAANSLFWNCTAARIDCYKPPTAQNWSFGSWGQFAGDGYWGESNNTINPRSLFYGQLAERLHKNVDAQPQILNIPGEASSSPSIEAAAELARQSSKPRIQLKEWIEKSDKRNPINITYKNDEILTANEYNRLVKLSKSEIPPLGGGGATMQIKNGWLVRGDEILIGKRQSVPWWSGGIQAKELEKASPAITRFVPGRSGKGLTDDLLELTASMKEKNVIGMEQNYGLWYDRRRDDHQRIRRMDGEVWPPFYELPFARSGKDTAWDGLSKYDLTKYNPFYWSRLKQFADLADQQGLLLINQQYFQHNIIEAGAHYADFPWRTANNINNTGFPEPPPYAGDKRIFMAEQFYDITDPVRKELHRKFIRQSLNNFKDNNGVIQLIGEEFTGPLHFVKFWLDVIRDWEKETGKHPVIGLSVTKDVQDSILNNPVYNKVIDLVDIRYWHYQADGKVYEPKGGQNLAPRQHARLLKPKKTSFEQVYRAVKEYRLKYPTKTVVYSGDSYPEFAWAAFMAGGSLPAIPALPKAFVKEAAAMLPINQQSNKYVLAGDKGFIIYEPSVAGIENLTPTDTYSVRWIDAATGLVTGEQQQIKASAFRELMLIQRTGMVVWCTKI
ncbi:MAG: DUF6298 domain-containing protein [Ferruginibacter sp.]